MELYDRYIDKFVLKEKDLPSQIDFGRYSIVDEDGKCVDITYSNLPTKKVINQDIFLEKNKNLQDIFIDIGIDIEKSENNEFNVIPLIRRIKNKLGLNEFEKLLYEKIFHLEEIFRLPYYLLEREIEKVHISRAKRIPSKSYQYLASHTEDWIHKSIVSFKPSRILNEALELNFDIYENQLTVAFVKRCLVYIQSRLKEIQDIKSFLSEYEKLLKNRNDQKNWYAKIYRNLSLIGEVYDDDHFHRNSKDGLILTETEEALNQINKRLLLLHKSDLFDLVNKRAIHSISIRNTNVIVNHKHYRHVKHLWIELDKVKPEKSESKKLEFEQDVFNGLRAYGKSIIAYTLKHNLKFKLEGNYNNFTGCHSILSNIVFKESNKGTFQLETGVYKIQIVIVGNSPTLDDNLLSLLKAQNTFLFYYHEQAQNTNSRFIKINPLDPDSIERVGTLIRKFLLMAYLDKIFEDFPFKPLLKDYIKYVPTDFIEFKNCNYKFHSFPKKQLSPEKIKIDIEKDPVFKTKSTPEKENIRKAITDLLNEIESNSSRLTDDLLYCFNCHKKLQIYHIKKLNYLKCQDCDCLIDSSNVEKIIFKIDDSKYNTLTNDEFGMDSLTFNKAEL